MAGFWESLFGGGATAGGIYALMDQLKGDRSNVQDTIGGLQDYIQNEMQFKPSTITSGVGSSGPGGTGTSQQWQQLQQQMLQQAGGALGGAGANSEYLQNLLTPGMANRADPTHYQGLADMKRNAYDQYANFSGLAGQDPAQRETDVYNRIREMQLPGEQRQMEQMNSNLFGTGRGGMFTSAYGGSPEQHAFGKAQAEARNQASLQAMGQAQNEMMNYGKLANQFGSFGSGLAGQQQDLASKNITDILGITKGMGDQMSQGSDIAKGLMGGALMPEEYLLKQGAMGQGYDKMGLETMMNRVKMMGDLGLGGLGTELNYSNIMSNLLGQAIPGLAGAAGGLGGKIDDAGGFFDFLKGIIPGS